MTVPRLLVAALRPEWSFLGKYGPQRDDFPFPLYRFKDLPGATLLQTGPGQKRMASACETWCASNGCSAVLHFGFCGALDPSLRPGELVLARGLIAEGTNGAERLPCEESAAEPCRRVLRNLGISHREDDILSVSRVIKTPEEKRRAGACGAIATDMESFAAARVFRKRNIPFAAMRAVFDSLDDDLTAVGEPYDERGELKTARFALNLLRYPSLVFKLPALRRRFALVEESLSAFVMAWLGAPCRVIPASDRND